jgi:threonine dehydrogenase-like Zn-dependent dehydrogenase
MAPHASLVRVDARTALCVPVPDGLPDEHAAFARFAVVSMTTMLTTTARGGDEVAVVGLGLVGNLAAQVLRVAGMRVHAIDLSETRRELARRCGIPRVEGPGVPDDLRRRHRLVVEASGAAPALVTAVRLAADGGEVVMVGAPWGGETNSVPTGSLMGEIFLRFLTVRSGSEWRIPVLPAPLAEGSIQHNTITALDWLASRRLRVGPLITHRLPAEQAAQAYDGLRERPDEFLGVVLTWR